MLTNRFSQIAALVIAAAITLSTLSFMSAKAPAATASALSDNTNYQFRLGEIAQVAPRDDAWYEYRLGEIAQVAPRFEARYEYRLGEIAQVAPRFDAQFEYRRGEWFGN
jgi:hypothetical protein